MNNILLVLAGDIGNVNLNKLKIKKKINLVVAVDGGYNHLTDQNISIDFLIGDLDSIKNKKRLEISKINIIKLPTIKDQTDFRAALNYLNNSYNNLQIYIVGYASTNRIDHLYSNLLNLKSNMIYINDYSEISLLKSKTIFNPSKYYYYSFFAQELVSGLSIKGFKYQLEDYTLKVNDPICISNQLNDIVGEVNFKSGKLICIKTIRD